MAYDEYDYSNESNEGSPSLKESLYNILNGLQNEKNLRETGQGLTRLSNAFPGVAESVGRGALASIPGAIGDISNFARSYAPETMNDVFGPRAFNTTREILNNIPRITPTHEGAETLEDVGAAIAPGVGGVVKDVGMLGKGLPVGLSIKDVSKEAKAIDELGFHSTLQKAVNNIGQPKGTGEQFLKQLEKTPGVKTEELEVTGLKNYLQEHPTVTKQEVIDHINQNKVKLENKVLSEPTGETAEDYQLQGGDVYHDQDYIDSTAEDLRYQLENDADIYHQEKEALVERFPELYEGHENEPDVAARLNQHVEENIKELADTQAREMYYENPIRHYYDEHGYDVYGNDEMGYSIKSPQGHFLDIGGRNGIYDISDAESALREHHLEQGNINYEGDGAKYEDYTLPGNYTNYREVLTTLPQNEIQRFDPSKVEIVRNRQSVTQGTYTIKYNGEEMQTYGDEFNVKDNYKGLSDNEIMQTAKKLYEQGNKFQQIKPKSGAYQSSHFDEPNILAHTRLNDRIINGKKTLMVEEIQSDWHQAGRRKGYENPEAVRELERQYHNLKNERLEIRELSKPYTDKDMDAPQELIDRMTANQDKSFALEQEIKKLKNVVPDAPFKKNWHELMMKQILNEAVKGDYDAVAFTTGKQQNERYNLAKYLDEVYYKKNDDGTYTVSAIDKNHRSHMGDSYTPDEIEQHLGKDMAKKIVDDTGKTIERSDSKSISGDGLSIGGEGMKGFYDKILPDFVNKYTKKYGMSVRKANTQASLQGEQVHFVELSDAAKKDIKEKGQPLFSGIGLAGIPMMGPDDQKKNGILKNIAKSKK